MGRARASSEPHHGERSAAVPRPGGAAGESRALVWLGLLLVGAGRPRPWTSGSGTAPEAASAQSAEGERLRPAPQCFALVMSQLSECSLTDSRLC